MAKQSRATLTALSFFAALKELVVTFISGLNLDASAFSQRVDSGFSEDQASTDGDGGFPLLAVRKATPANTSGTDGDYENLQVSNGRIWGSVVYEGPSWGQSYGIAGSATFTSADQSGAAAAVTLAPTGGQKLVIDMIVVSMDTARAVSFTEETSGTLLAKIFAGVNIPAIIPYSEGAKMKLVTADKRLMVQTSGAGNIAVTVFYHSEA